MIFASSFGPKKALTLGAILALPALFFSSGCAGEDPADPTPGVVVDNRPLPTLDCDYQTTLTKSCAIASCHRAKDTQGSLDLTVDPGLRGRIINVTAPHSTIDCDPDLVKYLECVPPPAACPKGDKYIDKAVPANSWLIKKLEPQAGCGDMMPMQPGDGPTTGWGPDAKACLIKFFNALAAGQ